MRQGPGTSQKALDCLEFSGAHIGRGEVVKALSDNVYEFSLAVGEACNLMHKSQSPHRIRIFI